MTTANETRAHLRKVQGKGCRTLEDIRLRCKVDDITGCWLWSLCVIDGNTPKVGMPAGVLRPKPWVMAAAKAAWLLSGRKLEDGQVIWRAHCGDNRCVNPAHCKALTRREMRNACGESNREKGCVKRAIANRKSSAEKAIPRAIVAKVEELRKTGKTQRQIAAELPVSRTTVQCIDKGMHVFSAKRDLPLLRAASVFTWGMSE